MTGVFPIPKYMQAEVRVRSDEGLHLHQGALAADAEALEDQYTEQVQSDTQYLEYRDNILETLEPFAEMLDGHLETVNIPQHRIELTPDAKPVN